MLKMRIIFANARENKLTILVTILKKKEKIMERFDREKVTIYNFRYYVTNAIKNEIEKIYVMIDRSDGCVVLMESKSRRKNYIFLGSVKTNGVKKTIKNINAIASEINKIKKKYDKESYICYSRAISEYGKKNVSDKAFIKEVDNPYYKCSAPMKLYDKNVIEFYLKK